MNKGNEVGAYTVCSGTKKFNGWSMGGVGEQEKKRLER